MSSSSSPDEASAVPSQPSESSRSPRKRKRSSRSSQESGQAVESGDSAASPSKDVRASRLVVPSSSSSPIEEDVLRGRPLAPATLSYFRAIQAKIDAFDEQRGDNGESAGDDEEVTLLVSAALTELKGAEYRLLVNRHGSRAVESLIARASGEQLVALLSALLPTFFFLATDRNASHTLERLLHRLPPLLIQEAVTRPSQVAPEAESSADTSVTSVLTALCTFLSSSPSTSALAGSTFSSPPSSHWPLLLCNDSSSHLLRSLFLLLTGHVDLPPLLQHFAASSSSLPSSSPSSPPTSVVPISRSPAPSSVSPQLDFALTEAVTSIVDLKEADRVELSYHSSASPTLQCLITALASHSTYSTQLQRLLAALLLIDDPSTGEVESATPIQLSATAVSHIDQLSRDRVGSHLMETVLTVSAVTAVDVFESVVRCWSEEQRLHDLSLHSLGNHVVQRLLSALSTSRHRTLLQRCLKRLRPHLRAYIDGNRLGVVWRCLQAAGWVSNRSRSLLLDSLNQALECKDATELLQRLLTLHPTPTGQGSGRMEGSTPPHTAAVSYFGSVMLQALLSLPSSTPLVSALLALPADAFLHLASNARGAHVLESVLAVGHASGFSHSLTHQHALVDLVIAHLLPLSHSVAGSFLVEKAYRAADSQRKRTISSQLASQQKTLQRSKSGQALLRTCGLVSGKPSIDRWAMEESKRRKAALFADILEDE